jgi:glutathione S-transferase
MTQSKIQLYGGANSRAFRVMWMLHELGLDYEQHSLDFMTGALQTDEFLQINVNGRIPALVDKGETYWESLAINLYLASAYGGPLTPVGPVETARAMQWSLWAANELETPLLVVLCNRKMFVPADRDSSEEQVALAKIARPLNALERVLKGTPHLIAERFTVADLNVASVMIMAKLADLDLSPWPNVEKWFTQALSRPAARGYESMLLPSGPRPPFWASIIM